MRRFPGVGFRGSGGRRRAWVVGTGLDVWEIVEAFRDFDSAEKMAAGTDLNKRDIALALAYAKQYPGEIEDAVAENRRPLDELTGLYPFLATPSAQD